MLCRKKSLRHIGFGERLSLTPEYFLSSEYSGSVAIATAFSAVFLSLKCLCGEGFGVRYAHLQGLNPNRHCCFYRMILRIPTALAAFRVLDRPPFRLCLYLRLPHLL